MIKEGSEELFRSLLESAPDAIVICDEQGNIKLINRRTEELFGYNRAELLGQPVEILIPASAHEMHRKYRTAYTRAPAVRPMGINLDLYGQHKNGRLIPVEISLSPMKTKEGTFIISVVHDISQRKRAQEQLAEQAKELARSNAELEQFAYVASHDLQEPLRMVASYCQLLAKRYRGKLDADADEFIGFAVEGANRMQRLINDLLTYSRAGAKDSSHFSSVSTQELLDQVLDNLRLAIEEAHAEINIGPMPTVFADARQIVQLFQNLMSNAIKFHSDDPLKIDISAEDKGENWLFTIKDNGIGIPTEFYEKIFVIFKHLHSREKYPGTGIGLAICKKIVERHNGRIWIESEPGKGAKFRFTLQKAQ